MEFTFFLLVILQDYGAKPSCYRIYKDKYMPPREDSPGSSSRKGRSAAKDDKDKKPRNKSRTRTIFGRARKDSAPAPPNA